jgi:hypothetical protein
MPEFTVVVATGEKVTFDRNTSSYSIDDGMLTIRFREVNKLFGATRIRYSRVGWISLEEPDVSEGSTGGGGKRFV